MSEAINLKEIERRPQRYWMADGLPELVTGLLWILWGGSWLIGETIPKGSAWNLYWGFTPVLLCLCLFTAGWVIKKLKQRLTFPRAGYVEWKEPSRAARLGTALVAGLVAAALAFLVRKSRAEGVEHIAAPGVGVLLCLAFVFASIRQRAPHLLALAVVALALGLVFGALKPGWEAINWVLLLLGVSSAVLGAIRLNLFLKRHPLPGEGMQP